tara:strand:- start:1626 stop:1919 length:294 start_codon:yes stop_codon:yes gene_type:complete
MKKLFKILLAIGGVIAGIFALLSIKTKSKKKFNKQTKANDVKLDFITKEVSKVQNNKKATKAKILKTSTKVKSTKSKIKSTKNAKKTVDNFEKKYRK